jgi:putative tryptophan/tyrosine transport system substrate-binding protein
LAADLVRRQVAVIVAAGGNSARAAKALTSTIPIVFGSAFDPVAAGLVASLNRPGGNVTGVVSLVDEIEGKRLGLLHELLPRATRFAVLGSPQQRTFISDLQAAAQSIGAKVEFYEPRTNAEIDATFADLVQKRADGLLVENLFLFRDRRTQSAIAGLSCTNELAKYGCEMLLVQHAVALDDLVTALCDIAKPAVEEAGSPR